MAYPRSWLPSTIKGPRSGSVVAIPSSDDRKTRDMSVRQGIR